ncbi:hypothetical protein [Amycolatopsis sp. NPDC021455]|uniref:hypothetical protein n=1 Tax=Amycolatopsis sp. NPDC021455 TaxID=3154901 RepID=UPI0033C7C440
MTAGLADDTPSFLDRNGRPVGPLEWDRLRSDPTYARLAQTVIADGERQIAVLTSWFGINLHPGPLFDTIQIENRRRVQVATYDSEEDALRGHQDAVAASLADLGEPVVEIGVDDRWDEFVRSTFRSMS